VSVLCCVVLCCVVLWLRLACVRATLLPPCPHTTVASFVVQAVTFSGPSSGRINGVVGSVDCGLVFTNTNLGQDSRCRWLSLTTLLVSLGFSATPATLLQPATQPPVNQVEGSTVTPCEQVAGAQTVLRLRPNTVSAVVGGVARNPAQCVVGLAPESTPAVNVEVFGPLNLGVCDSVVLDTALTVDTSGRGLSFAWQVSPANSIAQGAFAAVAAVLADPAVANAPRLIIPNSALTAGSQLLVQVTARNFLQGVGSRSMTVTVGTVPLPRISIDGSPQRVTGVGRALSLSSVGTQSATCAAAGEGSTDSGAGFTYGWQLASARPVAGVAEASLAVDVSMFSNMSRLLSRDPRRISLPKLQVGVGGRAPPLECGCTCLSLAAPYPYLTSSFPVLARLLCLFVPGWCELPFSGVRVADV
jgi:hypothetical protein